MIGIDRLQSDVHEWARRNFGDRPSWQPLLGAVEEIGELAHAHLKATQCIRGTLDEHRAAKIDAIGDVVIYLLDYCELEAISLETALAKTWDRVKRRDWKANPHNGVNRQ